MTVKYGWSSGRLDGFRTKAVTVRPRAKACATSWRPVPPVAPTISTRVGGCRDGMPEGAVGNPCPARDSTPERAIAYAMNNRSSVILAELSQKYGYIVFRSLPTPRARLPRLQSLGNGLALRSAARTAANPFWPWLQVLRSVDVGHFTAPHSPTRITGFHRPLTLPSRV